MRIACWICSLLLAVGLLAIPVQSQAQVAVGISIRIGPPLLPVYVQPICPEPGYIWVPGYWAYGPDGYFWVPGTWVEPPEVGLLWTPGYWGWEDDAYLWHAGYWGPEVGFYGGINYGFGYTGVGFFGGYWRGDTYFYNRAVTNVNVIVVRNTYNTTLVNNTTTNRVGFNGGPGGTTARPTSQEMAAERQRHAGMTSEQTQHQQAASSNRALLASVNHGRPDVAASPRPGQFDAHGAATKETNRPENSPANAGRTASVRPPSSQPPNSTPVNPALEQKHQREQDKLRQQQAQERQRTEQKHQQEQQKLQQRSANDPKRQDTERKQQQQLQQLERKQEQQQQKLQEKQQQERQRQQKPEKPPSQSKPTHNDKPPSQ